MGKGVRSHGKPELHVRTGRKLGSSRAYDEAASCVVHVFRVPSITQRHPNPLNRLPNIPASRLPVLKLHKGRLRDKSRRNGIINLLFLLVLYCWFSACVHYRMRNSGLGDGIMLKSRQNNKQMKEKYYTHETYSRASNHRII